LNVKVDEDAAKRGGFPGWVDLGKSGAVSSVFVAADAPMQVVGSGLARLSIGIRYV
jgi:hypothetical protein